MMKKIVVAAAVILCIAVFAWPLFLNNKSSEEFSGSRRNTYKYEVFPVSETGWGYRIYLNDKLFIQQETIPAVAGNIFFETKEDAGKIAELVIKKLSSGNSPSITKEELKTASVLK